MNDPPPVVAAVRITGWMDILTARKTVRETARALALGTVDEARIVTIMSRKSCERAHESAPIVATVGSASRELHAAANSLSANAEQTKRQIEAVAAATEQASANVVTVASAGTELSASVKEISRQATQLAQTVEAAAEVARVNGQDARIARIAGNIAHRRAPFFDEIRAFSSDVAQGAPRPSDLWQFSRWQACDALSSG